MNTECFFVHVKTENIYYKDIAKDVEKRFDTSNFKQNIAKRKKIKNSNWINERLIKQKNHDRRFWIKSKIVQLF